MGHISATRAEVAVAGVLLLVTLGTAYGASAWMDGSYAAAIVATSLSHTVLGVFVFMHHGGRRITASGMYFLASAIFVGMAGLGVAMYQPASMDDALASSTLAALMSNLVMYVCFSRRTASAQSPLLSDNVTAREQSDINRVGRIGVLLVGAGCATQLAVPSLKTLTMGAAFGGGVLILLAFVERWRLRSIIANPRWLLMSIVAIACVLGVFFSGHGRLNVASIFVAVGLMMTNIRPRSWYKRAFVIMVVPAIILGGYARAGGFGRPEVDVESAVIAGGEGLGSVWGPVDTFADIIRHRRASSTSIPLQYGATLWEAFVAPVPRALWPSKPDGLGLRLTGWLMPSYVHAGHSLAGTAYGEWYINFGWWGFPVGAVVIGALLTFLDRAWLGSIRRRRRNLRSLMSVAIWAVLIAGLADYVWVGFFTYNARAGVRATVLLGIVVVIGLLRSKRDYHTGAMPNTFAH